MKTQTEEKARLGSENEAGEVGHYYWPSEFPVAFCGTINHKHATLSEAIRAQLGPVCPSCAKMASGRPRTRPNPHRQGG